jgi:hypothetical protein
LERASKKREEKHARRQAQKEGVAPEVPESPEALEAPEAPESPEEPAGGNPFTSDEGHVTLPPK